MDYFRAIDLKEIKKYCNKILEEYKKYNNYKFACKDIDDFFSYPGKKYELIEENIGLIEKYVKENEKSKSILKEYDKLLENINIFISKIRESSYENDIFCEIRNNCNGLYIFRMRTLLALSNITNIKTDSDNEIYFDNNEQNNNKIELENFYPTISKAEKSGISLIGENNGEILSKISNNYENNDFGLEINKNDIQKIKKKFENIKNDYKFSKYYSNLLVKEEDFNNQNSADIEKCLPDKCKEFLLEFKKIRDKLIIEQCKIPKNKLDFKYNFIIPNINLESKKGGEPYYPPEGWFGFGVKVKNKYKNEILFYKKNENFRKANAYYSFNGMTPRKILKELNKIINKGFIHDEYNQPKCRCLDIRKKGNIKVGAGIYLSPKIDFIESNTGMICFNNKTYKIALMVSVLADKIRQPDSNYWILRKEEIEINKIILKEIHLDI